MRKSLIIISFGALLFMGVINCAKKEEEPPCSVAWAAELDDELDAVLAAAQAYGMNPSPTTCNAYKNAAQAYVDALQPYGNCAALTGQQRADWEAAVAAAEDAVDMISC
jgi:hypothetical protein